MSNEHVEKPVEKVIGKSFKLEDIVPEDQNLVINEKMYRLRKINLEDEAWLKKFGDVNARMQKEDVAFMAKLTFRQLVDKTDFLPVSEEAFDDDGNKITKMITGPERILRMMSGPAQRYEWTQTLMALFGISRPMFDQMVEDALKKNEINPESPAGEKSSI